MKNVISNQWDPGKGNYYLRQPDNDGRKCYDIRYTFNNIDFRGTLREQPYGARYAYRAEITAISPLTGMPIRGNAGDKIARSIYSNETDMDELLNTIVMAIIKLYSNNCIALNRAVEAFAIYRPEMTTPSMQPSALPYITRTRSPPRQKRRSVPPSTAGKRLSSKRSSHNCRRSLCARLNPWKSVASSHHGDYRSAITSSFATFGIGALKTNTAPEPIRFRR